VTSIFISSAAVDPGQSVTVRPLDAVFNAFANA
jgi:hypothetical protein